MSKFTGNIIRLPAVTPTQNSASGVYTLDDQFTAQSSGTWPIVRDQYFNYTTLLLTGAVQGTAYPNPVTQPYSFLSDASTNNFVVSPNGDVSARPFNPYLNNYSAFFDGTNDYCSLAGSADFSIPTSTTPFTVEAWIYPASASALSVIWTERYNGSGNTVSLACGLMDGSSFWTPGRYLGFAYYNGSGWTGTASNAQVELNTWSHVAYVFTGSACKIFLNGLDVTKAGGPTTWAITGVSGEAWYIGAVWDAGIYFNGYISNLRYVVGTAVYTSNFTPSTTPLQNITNTKLLACQSNRFIDNSSSPKTITPLNGVAVSQNSPFVSYDTTNGSGYFDGTGDYLSIASTSTALPTGTQDYSVEAWFYWGTQVTSYPQIVSNPTTNGFQVYYDVSAGVLAVGVYNVRNVITYTIAQSALANQWTHIVVTRSGNTHRMFVNGVLRANGVDSISFASLTTQTIGSSGAANYFVGYMSDVRSVLSSIPTAYQTSSTTNGTTVFTPPTALLPVVSGTSLLTLQTRAPATNNGFIDSSPNNFVVTRNGNTTQGSFSPFSPTGWGNYFSGSSAYLSATANTAFDFGTGDFTIEAWVYTDGTTETFGKRVVNKYVSNGWLLEVLRTSGNTVRFLWVNSSNATVADIGTNDAFTAFTWHHIAVSRSGANISLYVDGSRKATSSSVSGGTDNVSNNLLVGSANLADTHFDGYISNARLVKGTAVYDPTQTSITVPTAPLTAVSGTSLLTCQSNRFRDASSNNFTITTSGSPSVQAFSPFAPAQSYIPSQIGGSGYFDGTGSGTSADYLTWPGSAIGTSPFCFECWFYTSGFGSAQALLGPNSTSSGGISVRIITSTRIDIDRYSVASSQFTVPTMTANQWYHLVACRDASNNTTIFLNGVRSSTGTISDSYNYGNAASIGYLNSAFPLVFTGNIAGARLVTGSTPYDPTQTTITVPTAPPTAIPNTSLLLNFTNGGIVDATGKNNLETVGNSGVQTTQAKWSPGSIYIPKVGTDYLKSNLASTDLCAFGSGDFVIEFWLRLVALPGSGQIAIVYDSRPSGTNGAYAALYIDNATLKYYVSSADRITGYALSINTWYYIAVARASGNTRLYIDGSQQGATYPDSTVYLNGSQRPVIGTSGNAPSTAETINGYIDDLRVTKGSARGYSGTTIPIPTGPFPLG